MTESVCASLCEQQQWAETGSVSHVRPQRFEQPFGNTATSCLIDLDDRFWLHSMGVRWPQLLTRTAASFWKAGINLFGIPRPQLSEQIHRFLARKAGAATPGIGQFVGAIITAEWQRTEAHAVVRIGQR
jgi:hypothetical protein